MGRFFFQNFISYVHITAPVASSSPLLPPGPLLRPRWYSDRSRWGLGHSGQQSPPTSTLQQICSRVQSKLILPWYCVYQWCVLSEDGMEPGHTTGMELEPEHGIVWGLAYLYIVILILLHHPILPSPLLHHLRLPYEIRV